jgi:putative restriction endonuclease
MEKGRNWTRGELTIAFYQYCVTPFGRIHHRNPEIITLAEKIGRSSNALAMKMCNFASFDPAHQKRNVKGLTNVAKADRKIWDEFSGNWEELILTYQMEANEFNITPSGIPEVVQEVDDDEEEAVLVLPEQTELVRQAKARTVQSFFRRSVLANYDYHCAICRISHIKLLTAGHIIPWSLDEARRADPKNGLSLCALHDRAFDRGLLTLDDDYRVVLSSQIKIVDEKSEVHNVAFVRMEGQTILLPDKFAPDLNALEYHRNHIFEKAD